MPIELKKPKKTIYLDHAATTPLDQRVKKAMDPFWSEQFGNPSSIYGLGLEASHAVKHARITVADIIGARPEEIIFTAGGTESVNLAIFGIARSVLAAPSLFRSDRDISPRGGEGSEPHIITTKIEHHAVLNSCKTLEEEGCKVTYIDVDKDGFINLDELKKSVRPETVLVSIMYANNEIGTVEPIAEIGKWLAKINVERLQQGLPRVLFHTDACQAAGALDLNIQRLGVDLLSANGSKIYGPKQTGFLYVRSGIQLKPLIYGGGQEKDLRSGTENVPGIIGLAEALKLSQKEHAKESKRLRQLRDYFIKQVTKRIPDVILNGPDEQALKTKGATRLPNNINITIGGVEGEALMLYLDSYGIAVSTGSACTTGLADPSHVLVATGRTEGQAKGSIRITLGKSTRKEDLNYTIKVLINLVGQLRKVVNQN